MAGPPGAVGSVLAGAVTVKQGGWWWGGVFLQDANSWGGWGRRVPPPSREGEEVTLGPSSADHAQGRPGDQMQAERDFPTQL